MEIKFAMVEFVLRKTNVRFEFAMVKLCVAHTHMFNSAIATTIVAAMAPCHELTSDHH